MWPWLCIALAVALGSALIPFVNVELFVIGLALQRPDIGWALIAGVVATGHVVGKLFYYYAARGNIRLPKFLHRKPRVMTERRLRWELRTKRIRAWVAWLREKCEAHPHWMFGTYSVSAVAGLPPFMGMTVLAGLVKMKVSAFLSAGIIGRFVRFSLLAASPAVFHGWFH
ncbi:membrane protein [Actinokineospora soli]